MEQPMGEIFGTEQGAAIFSENDVIERNSEGGNPVEHMADGPILDLASALWMDGNDLKVFEGGIVELHNLSLETTRTLLGLSHSGEAVKTGLRFDTVLPDGTTLSSEPNFHGRPAIPSDEDTDQQTVGNVDITNGETFKYTLQVDCLRLVDADLAEDKDKVYTVTIIPDPNQEKEEYLNYYTLLVSKIRGDNQHN